MTEKEIIHRAGYVTKVSAISEDDVVKTKIQVLVVEDGSTQILLNELGAHMGQSEVITALFRCPVSFWDKVSLDVRKKFQVEIDGVHFEAYLDSVRVSNKMVGKGDLQRFSYNFVFIKSSDSIDLDLAQFVGQTEVNENGSKVKIAVDFLMETLAEASE